MRYAGRPGLSPVTATLLALGRIEKGDRILDVGCGTGTDTLLLARWGFRRLEGVDPDRGAIGIARARATRLRVGRRVSYHHLRAEELTNRFSADTFDVVLHTLVANNLKKDNDEHFRAIGTILKPKGLLVLQERVTRRYENTAPGAVRPLTALRAHFRLSRGISTHLPEVRISDRDSGAARVVLWIGEPRK